MVTKMENVKKKGEKESRSLLNRKGTPSIDDRKTGFKSGRVSGDIRKFVNIFEEIIKLKQENIYSYFSVFGPNKKTLSLSDKTFCGMESGHQCEGGIFVGGRESLDRAKT